MGGSTQKSTSQQQSTSSNTVDPQEMAMLQSNLQSAQTKAAQLQPYTGQLTAGFTPTQLQAQGVLGNVATDPTYQAQNTAASNAIQGVLAATPNTSVTSNPVTAQTVNSSPVTASLLANTDLSPYENPYTSDVINQTITQNERARQIANQADNQQATAAGAFGGSRSAVLNSLTNQAYDMNTANQIAGLNQANYSQAQQAALSDVGAQNQASQFNATNAQNASLANQSANLNAGEYNSTANTNAQQNTINNQLAALGLQLNAAGQLVSTANNGLNLAATQGGILSAVGDAQQAQNQTDLTNQYNEFQRQQSLPAQQQSIINQSLGLIPVQQTVNSSGTGSGTQTTDSGLGGILGSLGVLGKGLGAVGVSLSDKDAKTDIETDHFDSKGRRWVNFRYRWEAPGIQHHGVIAQEILRTDPMAVTLGRDGLYRVNYDLLEA